MLLVLNFQHSYVYPPTIAILKLYQIKTPTNRHTIVAANDDLLRPLNYLAFSTRWKKSYLRILENRRRRSETMTLDYRRRVWILIIRLKILFTLLLKCNLLSCRLYCWWFFCRVIGSSISISYTLPPLMLSGRSLRKNKGLYLFQLLHFLPSLKPHSYLCISHSLLTWDIGQQ